MKMKISLIFMRQVRLGLRVYEVFRVNISKQYEIGRIDLVLRI